MGKKNYKLKSIILFFVWIILLIIIPFSVSKVESDLNKNNKSYISSDLKIEEYNVVLDVNKDNKIDVTETITVNIPNDNYNGIYKAIPLWQKYYDSNAKEVKRKVQITNLRAIGEKYILKNSVDSLGIRVGSTRTNVEKGFHTYTIKYRYNMGKDMNKGFDNFIFNVFDNYDNTQIDSLSVVVNMPNKFNANQIKLLRGTENITDNINYTVKENALTIKMKDYLLDESLTINMTLKDGYFNGGTYNYGIFFALICIAIIIISIFSFISWIKYGKNYTKKPKTVEFYPPEDFDSAQIGYIYGEKSIKKLTASLIIQLASKGYISIEETKNKKYKIVNIGNQKDGLKKLSITEQIVYLELFKNGDTNLLYKDFSFAIVFQKVSECLAKVIDKKVNDLESRKRANIIFTLLFLSVITWTLAYLLIKDLNPKYEILYVISFISIFVTGFFTIFMSRKTAYGETINAKIEGFKDFLLTVEKDKLNNLVQQEPNYFYDILPYTYVLGVSKKWIAKFEKANVPNIDIDFLDFYENDLFMIMSE
jgi:hypothetical protein